jgi:hypothetical protein
METNIEIIKTIMKHTWDLCGELRNAKIEIWSCEVSFERSDQIEIEWLNKEKTNIIKFFDQEKVKKSLIQATGHFKVFDNSILNYTQFH